MSSAIWSRVLDMCGGPDGTTLTREGWGGGDIVVPNSIHVSPVDKKC